VKRTKAKNAGMVARQWFALLRTPDGLPVLFASRRDAEENRDDDEYLVVVMVRPASLADLGRGERAVLERRRAEAAKKKKRPRIPATEKRRRGTAIKIGGLGPLRAALKKVAPKALQQMRRQLDNAVGAIERGERSPIKSRGGRRAAAPRARR
jgi:hypothetical protein